MKQLTLQPLSGPLNATIAIPGSKSYTNRALIVAALAEGKSTLEDVLISDDTRVMISALRDLGVEILERDDALHVQGTGGKLTVKNNHLQTELSGTTSRFVAALALVADKAVTIDGIGSLRTRPIDELVSAMEELGATVTYDGQAESIPVTVTPAENYGAHVTFSGSGSSQFVSALLMVAPLLPHGLTISITGTQGSSTYIDMTLALMKDFGVTVEQKDQQTYVVAPNQKYSARSYAIEGDWSTASYFCAIGALHDGGIELTNLNGQSLQGDRQLLTCLSEMGATVSQEKDSVTISGGKTLSGITVDMTTMPDVAMTLGVVAAFAQGHTTLTGLASLTEKESDRLTALHTELANLGIKSTVSDDSITIEGAVPQGGTIATYDDHRIAMSFAVAGTKISDVTICDPAVVQKTCPTFWNLLESIGVTHK